MGLRGRIYRTEEDKAVLIVDNPEEGDVYEEVYKLPDGELIATVGEKILLTNMAEHAKNLGVEITDTFRSNHVSVCLWGVLL